MVRAVPPAISDALASPIQAPALQLTCTDAFDRPSPAAISSANAGRSALLRLDSGSYLRAYVNQPGQGADAQVYSQVVADLASAAQWSAYGLRTAGAAGQAGVALAQMGGTIFLFYQRGSDNHLCCQTSVDGTGWSAEAVVAATTDRCWGLASAGSNDLFAAIDSAAGNDGAQLVQYYRLSGGLWALTGVSGGPYMQIAGLGCVASAGAFHLAAGAVTRPGGALCLATLTYAAGAFGTMTAIHPLDDPLTGHSIPYPSVTIAGGRYRMAAVLYDSGSDTGTARNRCELWTSPDFVHWALEQIVAGPFVNGASVAAGPAGRGGWLLVDAGRVVLSTAAAGTGVPSLDLSDSVLAVTLHEPASGVTAGVVTLANETGQNTPREPPVSALRVGAILQLSLGYGASPVPTHTLYVDAMEVVAGDVGHGKPVSVVVLRVSNRLRLLQRTVPVERHYLGATVGFLAAEVAVGAGLPLTPAIPATPQFGQTVDSFAIRGGAAWEEHLRRLGDLYGFLWFLDEQENLTLMEPQAGDPVSFTYGAGVPPIERRVASRKRPNSVRVVGSGSSGGGPSFAEALDADAVQSEGAVVHRHVVDRLLTSSGQCAIRSGLELRWAQRSAVEGEVRLPLNPAHQPLDVIAVADGGVTQTLRIRNLCWQVDLGAGIFEVTASVEAP